MTEARCELTELLADHCAHCLGHTDPSIGNPQPHRYPADTDSPPTTTAAIYRSQCPNCDETISIGDTIVLTGGTGAVGGHWVCTECTS